MWPITEEQVLRYMLSLATHQLESSTISNHLSAITFVNRLNGCPDPCSGFLVQRFLAGLSHSDGPREDSCHPIRVSTLRDLLHILSVICHSAQKVSLFRAAFLTEFFGAFRISELVPRPIRNSRGRALEFRDISWHKHAVILHLQRSKTDQVGQGAFLTLWEGAEPEVFPVRVLRAYMAIRWKGEGPLFVHGDGSPLMAYQLITMLSRGDNEVGTASP
ncbi:hypothetical protein KIL84_022893 [Mauremys mutica]|uniref:Uncharacterized protein n=1 Tax=Mauremys mutica TaxID=74926 RepID=A0A9D3WP37_9SAUR|nr:hypothetical protein KIL84_022893 [Mauremys mutica]